MPIRAETPDCFYGYLLIQYFFPNIDLQANFWCAQLTNAAEYKDAQSLNDILTRMHDKGDYEGIINIVDIFLKSDIKFEDSYAKSLKNLISLDNFKKLEFIYHSFSQEAHIAKFHKLLEAIFQDPNKIAEYNYQLVMHRLTNKLPLTKSLIEAVTSTPESAWDSNTDKKLLYQLIKQISPNSNANKRVQLALSCLDLLNKNGIEKTDGSNLAPLKLLVNLLSPSTAFSPDEIQTITALTQ